MVLSARTSKGYEFASSNPTLLKTWLFSRKPILRNGITYYLPLPPHGSDTRDAFHEYSVVFSEPVAQGYPHPSLTEILVSFRQDSQPGQPASGKAEGVHEDDEYIEIDQDFMANSVLPSIGCVAPLIPCVQLTSLSRLDSVPASRKYIFTLVDSTRCRVNPPNDHTVLLKPSDLNKIGLISGDWVSFYQKAWTTG